MASDHSVTRLFSRLAAPRTGAGGTTGATNPDPPLGTGTTHPMTGLYLKYQGTWHNVTKLVRDPYGAPIFPGYTIYQWQGGYLVGPWQPPEIM